MIVYKTEGVCAKQIEINLQGEIVKEVKFTSGCPGNLMGISSLVKGMPIQEVINRLKGIKCGNKDTSCPDQLSKALENYLLEK
ncbi:uncharacterized protein TIGR03905 [Clostridium amylolyticum]|uniref:ribonucleoside-diphosphate reductase n=1 Tax=Clostridium amylolyticum TaxID=1121298 RepID=A0A1M6KQX7_9CLOT|nr:TIGR03905 family TSCPD domain-containing protein [Clostridium amylolyticum]SHJ61332.1 uncharacterized protein TIGR03905 [Clostridium amylolyticum]